MDDRIARLTSRLLPPARGPAVRDPPAPPRPPIANLLALSVWNTSFRSSSGGLGHVTRLPKRRQLPSRRLYLISSCSSAPRAARPVFRPGAPGSYTTVHDGARPPLPEHRLPNATADGPLRPPDSLPRWPRAVSRAHSALERVVLTSVEGYDWTDPLLASASACSAGYDRDA